MAQFTPCFFPKFAHTFTGPKRPVAIRTRIAPAENLQLLSVWNDGRLDSILQATWALVLRCYTDAEDICFGYQRVEADGSQQISDAANMPAMQLNIDSDDSIKTVMRKANDSGSNGSLSKTCDGISRLFNTILMLRSDFNSTKKINLGGYQQAHATTLPGEAS